MKRKKSGIISQVESIGAPRRTHYFKGLERHDLWGTLDKSNAKFIVIYIAASCKVLCPCAFSLPYSDVKAPTGLNHAKMRKDSISTQE